MMEDRNGPLSSLRGNHACIRVPDFEAGRDWWIETFDFVLLSEWSYEDMRLCKIAPREFPDVVLEIVGGGESKMTPDRFRPI